MQTRLYVVLFVGGSRIDDPLSFFLFFFYFILFDFICYSKVRQLQQLQLLSQSIHAQTYYTPKHTCNSTITHKVMPTVIYKCYSKKKKLIIFSKEEKLPRLQSPFVH